jgi:hypothetical protein
MTTLIEKRWMGARDECALHIERMNHARDRSAVWFPMNGEKYERMGADDITFLDQYIYRFIKLQDCMGERLFSFSLSLLGEDMSAKPFIDILNRLERLGVIPSMKRWMELREIRNDLTHEYPESIHDRIAALQVLPRASDEIISVYRSIVDYVGRRYPG